MDTKIFTRSSVPILKLWRAKNVTVLFPMVALTAVVAGGCALEPRGTLGEQSALAKTGGQWVKPIEQRDLPDLPDQPDWRDVLERAFLANGDLEAAYHQWASAVDRITVASAYPDSDVALGFDYMFTRERMKAWDRTTLSVGFDPSMMLRWPTKVAQQGKIALEEARARGMRFEVTKFALQERVLSAYLDYILMAERIRIQSENVDLLRVFVSTAEQRVRIGETQIVLLQAQTELELAANALATMRSEFRSMRAMLNGLLARPPGAPLPAPDQLPPERFLPQDDDRLIEIAVDRNPELAALAHEVAGRADALELARMAYIPDIAPQFSITGSISQMIGAMIVLPSNLVRIQASIEESQAMLRASEASARQARSDRAARFVSTLYLLRNYERQTELLRREVIPRVEQVLASTLRSYATGAAGYLDVIEAQRLHLNVQLLIAESRIAREKRLAELEALAGIDMETLIVPDQWHVAGNNQTHCDEEFPSQPDKEIHCHDD